MIIKIRSKLIFSISLLVLILLSSSAILLTNEKKIELSSDMYAKNLAFSRLVAENLASNYDTFLKQDNFLYFNRVVQNIFLQNSDLSSVKIISYSGEVLYDSLEDLDKRYSGMPRIIENDDVLSQIRSKKISFYVSGSKQIYFLNFNDNNELIYFDNQDKEVLAPDSGFFAEYFSVPVLDKYSVVFYFDYSKLTERVNDLIFRIAILTAFGVLLGVLLSFILARQFNKPLSQLLEATEKVSAGDYDTRVDIKSRDELSLLGMSFNKMANDLKAGIDARVFKEKVGREIELASQIQTQLIPKLIPKVPGLDISAAILPADEIGGDMYDFLPSVDENHMFYLGDVTGHGIPAGLLSSVSSALFYGFSKISDLKEILVRVNEVFHAKTMSNMFMTLCLVKYNDLLNKFFYVSAGHEQVVKFSASENSTILLPSGGVALGMTKDISKLLTEVSFTVSSGDFAIIYSDGIPESWNQKRELYGMQRLLNVIQLNSTVKTAKEMRDAILNDVKHFADNYKQMDDITIIVLRKD